MITFKQLLEGTVVQGPWKKKEEIKPEIRRSVYDQREAKPKPFDPNGKVKYYPAAKFTLGGWYYLFNGSEWGPYRTQGEAEKALQHEHDKAELSKKTGKEYW